MNKTTKINTYNFYVNWNNGHTYHDINNNELIDYSEIFNSKSIDCMIEEIMEAYNLPYYCFEWNEIDSTLNKLSYLMGVVMEHINGLYKQLEEKEEMLPINDIAVSMLNASIKLDNAVRQYIKEQVFQILNIKTKGE